MSLKHSHTTSDFLQWDSALNLVRNLYSNGEFVLSLLIGCGCFFGLRISDLLRLRWVNILNNDSFTLLEKKTSKSREIRINDQLQKHIQDCYQKINPKSLDEPVFISKKGTVYSIQRLNKILKDLKSKYKLKIDNFSTHSLRKTFGRAVFERSCENGQGELSLIKLSHLFNHASPTITRLYLGLTREEMLQTYELLTF